MSRTWRSWLPGPKHGTARGVAAFGSGESDPGALFGLLAPCAALRVWAGEHGVLLDDDPDSLRQLDDHLDEWGAQPDIGPHLGNEVGCYLGTVIVKQVPGAQWQPWPNGHPVVHTASGREFDVIALVGQRLRAHEGTLPEIYAAAASSR